LLAAHADMPMQQQLMCLVPSHMERKLQPVGVDLAGTLAGAHTEQDSQYLCAMIRGCVCAE
jgi:hypothetical protein